MVAGGFPAPGQIQEAPVVDKRLIGIADQFAQACALCFRESQKSNIPVSIEEPGQADQQMLAIAAVVGEHIMLDKRTIRIEAIVVHTAHSGNFHLTARSKAAGQAFLHPLQQLVVLSQNGSQQQIVTFPD